MVQIKDISDGNIEICRELCNELMAFQASKSHIRTDVLAEMTFDNRLKPSFESAQMKKVLVAFDNDKPIGYVYAEVSDVREDLKYYVPDWANKIYSSGQLIFFPEEQELPSMIGTFNNIYIKPEYHGLKLGYKMSDDVIEWM